jgi:hypothetical protein
MSSKAFRVGEIEKSMKRKRRKQNKKKKQSQKETHVWVKERSHVPIKNFPNNVFEVSKII